MLIGDSVTYDGQTYNVVGFTPASVRPAQVQLSDPATGATVWVDLPLQAEDAPERAALRLVSRDHRRKFSVSAEQVALTPQCGECGLVWLPTEGDCWRCSFDSDGLVLCCPACAEREFDGGNH
jgi:hypothetical protein